MRPAADQHLAAGKVEIEKGLDVLLDGDAADIEEDRLLAEQAHLARPEQLGVDAARPAHQPLEAAGCKLVLDRLRGDEGAGGAVVEPPLQRIAPGLGDRQPRRDIFGEARVIARGERPFASCGNSASS